MTEIWEKMKALQKQERLERGELLKEHDEKFNLLRQEIQQECEREGHVKGNFWDNGLGYTWYYCERCGAIMEDTMESYR